MTDFTVILPEDDDFEVLPQEEDFEITSYATQQVTVTFDGIGLPGANGLSAYELAVANGFVGTITDWLNSFGGVDQLVELEDVEITSPSHGDVVRYDDSISKFRNVDMTGWSSIGIVDGVVTPNMDLTPGDKFSVVVSGDCEIGVPINAQAGTPIVLRLIMSGAGHTVTFAAGWLGVPPNLLTGDGDENILSGIVLDVDPATTGVINTVKSF